MALLKVLVLWVGMCSAAPVQTSGDSTPTNETAPSPSASFGDSHVRQERSLAATYGVEATFDTSKATSPYYADLQGFPSPTPPTLTTQLTPPPAKCMDKTACFPLSKYRTISGRCNNLDHPEHGTPGQTMHFILPQHYDSPAVFRTRSVSGGLLPNPRHVSLLMRLAPKGPKVPVNSLFVQMGQFIDHDLSITTTVKEEVTTKTGERVRVEVACKECSSWHNPACAPVLVPYNDPYQPPYLPGTNEYRCLPFTRSVGHMVKDSQGRSVIQQPNFNTVFLDVSLVYGNDPCTAESLRQFSDGKLKSDQQHMLTRKPAKHFPVCVTEEGFCYHSGDIRANENVGLTMMHTLFHRSHNHLAEGLKAVNPHWDDEKLYQEARRINIAQYQNIVYSEYLPLLLGYHTAAKNRLIPHHDGYFKGYDATIEPGVYNEFSTAAFRMGHSQVPKYITLMNEKYEDIYRLPLHYAFFNATLLSYYGIYDPVMRGLLQVPMEPTDLNLVEGLGDKLFKEKGKPYSGHDLFVLNTARGRDHGLAPYVNFLKACGVKEVSSFNDLEFLMPRETVALLMKAYEDVRDIDLYSGGLAEVPLPGSLVGPTFSCIIVKQFLNLKLGDRFWFEGLAASFTHAQLQSLRQVTLAGVICDTLDNTNVVGSVHAFQIHNEHSNPHRRCSSFPRVNLELWRETPNTPPASCTHLGKAYLVGHTVPVSRCLMCVCQPEGKVRCQCDQSGCKHLPHDCYCEKVCGDSSQRPQPQYQQ